MTKKLSAFLILIAASTISLSAYDIKGKVADENGEPLAGATVVIKGTNKGVATDIDGKFKLRHIDEGENTIEAKLVGFEVSAKEINLQKDSKIYLDFQLNPKTQLQEIEVFGERYKQPEKLDAITRMPLRPSEQIQSISIISEKVIAEQGALTITDVVRNVPGITLFGSYGGVRESLSTRGYRGVPILKNGVRVDSDFRTAGLASDMQGVESVQVIKGSAAITQGVGNDLGSPGGVINVVTKTPKFVDGGEVGVRVGSWGQARSVFDIQSVLDKKRSVAFRLNGAYERGDGFKRLTKSNRVYINPSLEWRPDDKTTVTLEMDYLDDDKTPDVGTVNLSDITKDALYEDAKDKYFGFTSDNVNNKTTTYAARITRQLAEKVSLRAAYFGSSYQVSNTSSGLNTMAKIGEDGLPMLDENKNIIYENESSLRNRTMSHSTRDDQNRTFQFDLIGRDINTGSIKHTVQAGFDYKNTNLETVSYGYDTYAWKYNKKTDKVERVATFASSIFIDQMDVFSRTSGLVNTLNMPSTDKNPVVAGTDFEKNKVNWRAGDPVVSSASSYGIMLQDVTTFNQYLKMILGLRYSYGTSRDNKGQGVVTGDAWNPMVGVMITPIKNLNLFGSYTTTTSLRSAANKMKEGGEIGASTSTQWEFGIKSDWLEDRLRFNFTYFDIINKNLSNTYYEPNTTQSSGFLFKAGDLKRRGIETELSGRILDNLQVMLGYAYLDAFYDNSPSYVNGSAPMNAPKHTANGWVQYTLKQTALKGLSIGLGTYYVGKRPVNEHSNSYDGHGTEPGAKPFDMPGYTTINAQLGYTYGKVTARVFFNNISDALGYNSYFRGGYINQIDPRNFAGQISYRF